MRFSLRVLLIIMLLAGPLCAWGWKKWQAYQERLAQERAQDVRVSQMQPYVLTGPTPSPAAASNAAGRELWVQERDKMSWESFPESERTAP